MSLRPLARSRATGNLPPKAVQPTRIGGIDVVDDTILEHKRAHARPLARVRGRVGSGHDCVVGDGFRDRYRVHRVAAALVVYSMAPSRCCSSVNETLKSKLKSLPSEDAQGNVHPIRCLYTCNFASGARDTGRA